MRPANSRECKCMWSQDGAVVASCRLELPLLTAVAKHRNRIVDFIELLC